MQVGDMKVGDLVRAPYLLDHDGSVGLLVGFMEPRRGAPNGTYKIVFANGVTRYSFPHLLEVVNASR